MTVFLAGLDGKPAPSVPATFGVLASVRYNPERCGVTNVTTEQRYRCHINSYASVPEHGGETSSQEFA